MDDVDMTPYDVWEKEFLDQFCEQKREESMCGDVVVWNQIKEGVDYRDIIYFMRGVRRKENHQFVDSLVDIIRGDNIELDSMSRHKVVKTLRKFARSTWAIFDTEKRI